MNTPSGSWSLGYKLSKLSSIIFLDTKEQVLENCIRKTETKSTRASILLDNELAWQSQEQSDRFPEARDATSSNILFAQMFRSLQRYDCGKLLRNALDDKGRLFVVTFKGRVSSDHCLLDEQDHVFIILETKDYT